MKKYCILILMFCFLLPSTIFASSGEVISEDNVSQQSEILSKENEELVAYLRENVSSEEDVVPAIETFFAERPQYVENDPIIECRENKEPQKVKTVEIYSEKEMIDAEKERGAEVSLIFYDDDSFIIEQFSYESGDTIELSELNNAENLSVKEKAPVMKTVKTAIGTNTHQRVERGVFKWRTFLEASFWHNGTTCQTTGYRGNQRVGNTNIVYHPAYYSVTNPYGDNVLRVMRLQHFHEYPGRYSLGQDDLRVSCNAYGRIMKN